MTLPARQPAASAAKFSPSQWPVAPGRHGSVDSAQRATWGAHRSASRRLICQRFDQRCKLPFLRAAARGSGRRQSGIVAPQRRRRALQCAWPTGVRSPTQSAVKSHETGGTGSTMWTNAASRPQAAAYLSLEAHVTYRMVPASVVADRAQPRHRAAARAAGCLRIVASVVVSLP
jgi:hypothetical protein